MTYTIAVCTVKNSWLWTEELPETCRVLFQKYIWKISASSWFYYKNLSRYTVTWMPDLNHVNFVVDLHTWYLRMTTAGCVGGTRAISIKFDTSGITWSFKVWRFRSWPLKSTESTLKSDVMGYFVTAVFMAVLIIRKNIIIIFQSDIVHMWTNYHTFGLWCCN